MDTLAMERQEAEVALAAREPGDSISAVVGSSVYSTHHRFDDLRISMFRQVPMSASSLTVSRFYFAVAPQVVVDVIEHPHRFKAEIAAKRAYCTRRGIRYVLLDDDYDEDRAREQLTPARVAAPKPAGVVKPRATGKPARPQRPRKAAAA